MRKILFSHRKLLFLSSILTNPLHKYALTDINVSLLSAGNKVLLNLGMQQTNYIKQVASST